MGVFLWRLQSTKARHNAAVGLNNIVIADVVGFLASYWAAKTVEATEEYPRIDFL